MFKRKGLLLLYISSLIITTLSTGFKSEKPLSPLNKAVPLSFNLSSPWVDSVFHSLSLEDRIAQLIMIGVWPNRDQKHIDEIADQINKHHVGGLIFFQGGPIREAQLTNYYQFCTKTPLFVGIDGEWGLSMRLDSVMTFPREMMLGALPDNYLIYEMGFEIANQLKALGIQINFAPVVDVNNNPLNPVISNRSFGENKYLVADKGIAYMMGMQDNGILAVGKHFPGHGDTNEDSHLTLPMLKFDNNRLDSIELYPFRQLISKNLGGMMIGHLYIPALDSAKNRPSTLSNKIITGLLKKKMNFQGLIFTDALNMKGVSDSYKDGELEVEALRAGNDVLLMPANVNKAIKAIKDAINEGRLRKSQIDSSCRKILAAKEWAGLNRYSPIDVTGLNEKLSTTMAKILQRKIAASGITLIENKNNVIPLKQLDTLRLATVLIGTDKSNLFNETLSLYKDFDCFYLPKQADSAYVDSLLFCLRHYNLVIAAVQNTDSRLSQNFGIAQNVASFLQRLVNSRNVILNLFATPYALNQFQDINKFRAIIVSYQDQPAMQDYSAQLIFGGIGAKGKLPVTAASFPISTGINTPDNLRLSYSMPEEVTIDSRQLAEIDSIVMDAIRKGAMPGCQVLAARNGVVFYQKSFGHHTYENIQPVLNTDIYDIASITKIAGTLPAVMKLYDEGKLDVKAKLTTYLPDLKKSNKKDVVLFDLLTHQAQLQPFVPFYLRTIEPANTNEGLTSKTWSPNYPLKLAPGLYAYKDIKYKNGLYSKNPDIEHGLQVADNLYMANSYADSIYNISRDSKLLPVKKYEYSDMDFYYLFWTVEKITKKALNEYVETNFYNKLGAGTLGYLPLNRFEKDRIPPTENDLAFRKQLIQGYVHDPGAAMLGGVCGHAGVFSSANDLAKLMQMYLNHGSYGGEQYIKPATIDFFTSAPFYATTHNRRGLGFDKPDLSIKNGPTCQCVSPKTFGHQGFTGCVTWADPETGLLYIFLSNRINPDANNTKLAELNVRTRIQEVLAKAIEPALSHKVNEKEKTAPKTPIN
jgi:beta-glucosidase-like glycosyl hydrolase/CubicO group peptidase (beta-lactamase class C family)